jgi:PKD repeat protein
MRNMPNGQTTLTSRMYDLSLANRPLLKYYQYLTSEFIFVSIPGSESKMILSVSNDNGNTWKTIDTIYESTWDWVKAQVFLEDYIQPTNQMKFRFTVESYELQPGLLLSLTEALIDDFEILYSKSSVAPPALDADFSAEPKSGVAPLNVKFYDSSKGSVTTWWWDFGDGSNSAERNPVHQYISKGSYNVTLTVSDGTNEDTKTRSEFINVSSIKADFTADIDAGLTPLEVQFTDKTVSVSEAEWLWDFGDGSEYSTEQNPKHIYTEEGSYTVILFVKNQDDSSEVIKDDYISVYDVFGASFTADRTSGPIPFRVNFSDESFGEPTSWEWDFGDGSTSTDQTPQHTYNVQGIYNVSLTVSDGTKNSTKTRTNFISAYHQLAVNDESGLTGISVYPNPFSSSTAIYYELSSPVQVSLKIYDLMGNEIKSVINESQSEGKKVAVWNGTKSDGNKVNTGIYFYRLQAGSKTISGKLILY